MQQQTAGHRGVMLEEFHVAGPATVKLRGPQQTVSVAGTTVPVCKSRYSEA